MPTPHNKAKKEDFAKTVIMPGDPIRAKYIAENYFEYYKLINDVNNKSSSLFTIFVGGAKNIKICLKNNKKMYS